MSKSPNSRDAAILALHGTLLERRDALSRTLSADMDLLRQVRHAGPGNMCDAAQDDVHSEIGSQLIEAEERELIRIVHALELMEQKKFGLCERCGSKIPMARLNALPYATLCVACARARENGDVSSPNQRDNWGRLHDSAEELDPEAVGTEVL